jgi:hypothetical protein
MAFSSAEVNRNDQEEPEQRRLKGGSSKHTRSRSDADHDWPLKHPQLQIYYQRIGAEPKNFRRAVVCETEDRYRVEIALINVAEDGTIRCSDEDRKPSDLEQQAIRDEFKASPPPTSTGASEAQVEELLTNCWKGQFYLHRRSKRRVAMIKERLGAVPVAYPFYDLKAGSITMVQQRIERDDGRKCYLSWTYWSDGKWRCMEPDGSLPLWRPSIRRSARIMIHEGAKAAAYLDWMLNDITREAREVRAKHPWTNELDDYEHWGWIGGAPNPQRTDWSQIPSDASEIVLVCDNDKVGKDAAPKISRILKRAMKVIMFTDEFDEHFDLADDPNQRAKRYLGEIMETTKYKALRILDLTEDATWATEKLPNGSAGAPSYRIRDEFAKNWYWSVSPRGFVHRDMPRKIYSEDEFNAQVRPYSDLKETAGHLMKVASQQAATISYEPARRTGIIHVDGERKINVYEPTHIRCRDGDEGPWLKFMEHLVPEADDRHETLRWCATLIAEPGTLMHYQLLLVSEQQGVGKTTLADILRALVGAHNTSIADEQTIVNSAYTDWLAKKRLVVVHEIYDHNAKATYNKLKSIFGNKIVRVNEKYVKGYDIPLWAHVLASSNSLKALKLEDTDRRWLVPRITEETKPKDYWKAFYAWLSGDGLGIIRKWALGFVKEHGAVSSADRAPMTSAKHEMIEEGWSEGEKLLDGLGAALMEHAERGTKIVTSMEEVRHWLARRRGISSSDQKLESEITVSKRLRAKKMNVARKKIAGQQIKLFGTFAISELPWSELKEWFNSRADLDRLFPEIM